MIMFWTFTFDLRTWLVDLVSFSSSPLLNENHQNDDENDEQNE